MHRSVFSRRSWVDGDTYYTVTKSCTHATCPPRPRCRRVDEFYSSWRMRPVQARNGGIACEVVLQHFEEMGIQHDLAKLAVRRGMWCVSCAPPSPRRSLRSSLPALPLPLTRRGCVHPFRGCVENMERGLWAFIKRRKERLRSRTAQRRVSSGAPTSPKSSAGLPRGGQHDMSRPTLPLVLLRTGLMAIGGLTVARHAAGAGPQLAGAVGSALLGRARHRSRRPVAACHDPAL